MAVTVKKIIDVINPNKLFVEVQHYDESLRVNLCGSESTIKDLINTEIIFEIDYEKVQEWSILTDFNEIYSGLYKGENGSIIIRGTVHNIVDGEGDTIIDIYSQKGPEFVAITSSEIDKFIPQTGDAIEIVVVGFCIYPVNY